MKKLFVLLFSVFTLTQMTLVDFSLFAQAKKTAQQDTTEKSIKDKSGLELPDVIIYGKDKVVRKTGEKIDISVDDSKIVAPAVNYQLTATAATPPEHGLELPSVKALLSTTVLRC